MNPITKTMLKLVAGIGLAMIIVSSTPSPAHGGTTVFASPPTSYIIGISPDATGESAEIIIDGITDLALAAKKGTPFTVYDALKNRKITGFITPAGRSERINERKIKKSVKAISEYLDRAQAVRVAKGNQVHLPGFLDTISSSVRSGGGGTRVVIFGSLFFTNDREPSASFSVGFVPSDGHVITSSYKSVYGTADKQGALAGVAVDICTLGHQVGAIEQRSVERFWSIFLAEQSGVLTSVEAYPDVLINRAIAGAMDPVTNDQIDRSDTAIEIRPVGAPPPPPPAPALTPKPSAISTLTVDMAIIVDGSASMDEKLPVIKQMTKSVADLASRITRGFRLMIEIYRQRDNTSSFSMTPIEPPINGVPSFGSDSLTNFMDDEKVTVIDSSGNRSLVAHFQGQSTFVDVEGALMRGIRKLELSGGDRMLLVLIGDCGPIEMDGSSDFSEADRMAIQRTLAAVHRFIESHDDVRVLAVFTGDETNSSEAIQASVKFYRDLAALAGDHGVYTTDLEGIEPLVSRAILSN